MQFSRNSIYLRHIYLVLFVMFTFTSHSQEIFKPTFKGSLKKVKEATVLIAVKDSNNQVLRYVTGLVVAENTIATPLNSLCDMWYGRVIYGKKLACDVLGYTAVDIANNVILLQTSTLYAKPVSLVEMPEPDEETNIYVIDNPFTYASEVPKGKITRSVDTLSQAILFTNVLISPTNSGAAVINDDGTIIGISQNGYSNGKYVNILKPTNSIIELIAKQAEFIKIAPDFIPPINNDTLEMPTVTDEGGNQTKSLFPDSVDSYNFGDKITTTDTAITEPEPTADKGSSTSETHDVSINNDSTFLNKDFQMFFNEVNTLSLINNGLKIGDNKWEMLDLNNFLLTKFSIENNLNYRIANVKILFLEYDRNGAFVKKHTRTFLSPFSETNVIRAGFHKYLNLNRSLEISKEAKGSVEIRILDYTLHYARYNIH